MKVKKGLEVKKDVNLVCETGSGHPASPVARKPPGSRIQRLYE